MKKKFAIVIIILLVILGAVYGWRRFIAYETAKFLVAFKSPTAYVSATPVKAAVWHTRISAIGSTIANQGVEINAQVPGQVTKIYFKSGEKIQKGEPIIQLDQKVLKAQLANDEATLKYAKVSYFRQKALLAKDAASRSALDKALSAYKQALAGEQETKAQLAKTVIKAPFSGLLGIRKINVGQFLNAGQAIVSLQALSPMYVDFSLPENAIANVKVGYPVDVKTVAYANAIFKGNIIAMNSALASNTRSLEMRAEVKNVDERLIPGMFANLSIILPAAKKVLLIPQIAINYSPVGDFVYLAENGLAKRQYITVGERRGNEIAVLKGLTVNQPVVYAGQLKLENGSKVIVEK